jgi:flagellar motor component MotA
MDLEIAWFAAALGAVPALVALVDRQRDEARLGAAMAALAGVGALLAPALGIALALGAWAVVLPLVRRRDARRDMERRHRAIMRLLKLRVGVSDRPSRMPQRADLAG